MLTHSFQLRARLAAALALALAFPVLASAASDGTPTQIHLKPTQLEPLSGQYRLQSEPDVVLSFSHDGSRFFVESPRSARTELLPESPDAFFIKGSMTRFTFLRVNGKITQMRRDTGHGIDLADRISDKPVRNNFRAYDRQEVMIPVRDGVKLHAILLRPAGDATPLPFLMQRTPYGVDESTSDSINERYTELAQSGYIFVMADIRGRYKSEGQFVMVRPLENHKLNPKAVDESTDTYDTVDWLLKNVPNNNGRVGVMGVSYPGFLATMAGIDAHPAVKAISPQAPMTDVWLGDDFFHNGAFRQTYGYDYAIGMESTKENAFSKLTQDGYDYFAGGSFADAGKKSGATSLPTWKAFVEHPSYDDFWRARAVQPHLDGITVPVLEVGGFWDQEDMWGPQAQYAALEPHNAANNVFLVLGPWNHGAWGRPTTRHLGDLDFGAPTGDQFRAQIEAPFFAHYLKDQAAYDLKNTATFQTGSNRWMRYGHWPPVEGMQPQNLYLAANAALSWDKPKNSTEADFTQYTSDPANPVPYRKRPIEATYAPGSHWYNWLVEDQRFLGDRKDVISFSTPVLDHDVTVTGDVLADLWASTSGTDSDWVVKLIDVYPDDAPGKMAGYQLMIADEIFRGRYRKSFEKPEAAKPGDPAEYRFSLHAADHVFLKGHRVMVQVQSSWFPLYDRNPQTFVPNVMTAAPGDYQSATQKIYWSEKYPSHLELPIAK